MNKKILIAAVALVAVIALLLGIWWFTRPSDAVDSTDGKKIGKLITVTISHKDGTDNSYSWQTNAKTLAEAMNEKGLLGDDVDGMYYTIDGETTDYSVDKSWWCLNVNGEMAIEGANTIVVNDGDDFHWVYTIG
jgi:hypothetical protein